MEKLLTCDDVAELLQIKPKTVDDWARQGYLPCIWLGPGSRRKNLRFREEDILDLLKDEEQQMTELRMKNQSRDKKHNVIEREAVVVSPGLGVLTTLEEKG